MCSEPHIPRQRGSCLTSNVRQKNMKTPEERISEIVTTIDDKGNVTHRESSDLEFKETFGFKGISKYLKSFGAFANAHGGLIVFGIADSPRQPKGIDKTLFNQIEQEKGTPKFSI
jgi:predicted HTH transcriptional regulator